MSRCAGEAQNAAVDFCPVEETHLYLVNTKRETPRRTTCLGGDNNNNKKQLFSLVPPPCFFGFLFLASIIPVFQILALPMTLSGLASTVSTHGTELKTVQNPVGRYGRVCLDYKLRSCALPETPWGSQISSPHELRLC